VRRWIIVTLKVALAATLIALLIGSQEIPFEKLGRLRERWPWLLLAQLPAGLLLVLAAWRWKILLGAQGIEYSAREALSLTWIGFFFSQVTPGSTGGDLVKAYYVAVEHPTRRAAGILSVFLDRLVGLIVLGCVAAIGILLNLPLVRSQVILSSMALALGAGLFACLVGGFLFFLPAVRVPAWLQALPRRLPFQRPLVAAATALLAYRDRGREMLRVVALSAGIHGLVLLTNYSLYLAVSGEPPPFVLFLVIIPMAQIVMAVPLTPASWGVAELAYHTFFGYAGVREGAVLMILVRLTHYFWAAVGLGAYLRRRARVRQAFEAFPDGLESAPGVVTAGEAPGGRGGR
jgi:uncharacterized membrane protein YbhN (UPF0104 family)